MAKIINVNLMRHGDGKQVYISIMTDDGEIVIRGDRIAVNVDRNLPDGCWTLRPKGEQVLGCT